MRKLTSRNTEDKKRKRNAWISGIVLIVIMFLSTVGYAFINFSESNSKTSSNEATTLKYNGLEFTQQNGFWLLSKDNRSFIFRYNPNEVENIPAEINSLSNLENKVLYIQSNDLIAKSEISANILQFVEDINNACLEGSENCSASNPIKTCQDNFIIIREGELSSITKKDNCVFIEGRKEDLVKVTDEYLFKLINVQNNN